MKKFIIILLLLLPLFLIVAISLAGRIYTLVSFVEPTGVAFREEDVDAQGHLKLGLGETHALRYEVLPENATNKAVRFDVSDDGILSVTEDGVITGLAYGQAVVTVKTQSGRKTAELTVNVTDSAVAGVSLSETEKTAAVYSTFRLTAAITPRTAENKNVIWSSSDDSVVRVEDGVVQILRVPEGADKTVIITVTTEDGHFTDSCTVTVTSPRLAFKATMEGKGALLTSEKELKILDLLLFDETVDSKSLCFETGNRKAAEIIGEGDERRLVFLEEKTSSCTLTVTLSGDAEHEEVQIELVIRYIPG